MSERAIEAARRAIEAHPAYDCGSTGDEEMARAAIRAYLAALAEDDAAVEKVAQSIYATSPIRRMVRSSGPKDSRYHDVPYPEADYLHEDMRAAARAAIRALGE